MPGKAGADAAGNSEGKDMKKITAIVFALVLAFCLLPTSALAVGSLPQPDSYGYGGLPQPDSYFDYGYSDGGWSQTDGTSPDSYTFSSSVAAPVITSQPADVVGTIGGLPVTLSVGAAAYSGELHYQWYAVDAAGLSGQTAIPGAYASAYTPPETAGTAYYCVGVYAVSGNMRSDIVMSGVAAVNFSGIQIISAPTKTSYIQGESVSLKGLVVRVYDASGSYWDSYDGNGLSMYPSKLDTAGQTVVELGYGVSTASFYVTVRAAAVSADGKSTSADGTAAENADGTAATTAEHVHEYDDWIVTKEANCVTTGIRSRTCRICGEVQTEVIPKTDHTWDEGVITKQPTETSNGSRLYTCTVCKANKSEIIPAGTVTAPAATISAAAASAAPTAAGTVSGGDVAGVNNNAADNTGVVGKTNTTAWWLIPVSALLLVGCGTGAYYLMKKKGGE